MSRHNRLIKEATRLMDDYNYGEAGRQMYDFFWSEYADWYIEMAKIRLKSDNARARSTTRQVLVYVLEHTLRLLHPYIPFVTEAAWQHLPHQGPSLMLAPWPEVGVIDEAAEADMGLLITIIRAIRNARAEYNVEPGKRISALIAAGDKHKLLNKERDLLATLARLNGEQLHIAESLDEKPLNALTLVEGGVEIYLPLSGLVDIEAERKRLRGELKQVETGIARTEKMLANKNFTAKAPAAVVQRERSKLSELKTQALKLRERLETFG